MGALLVHHLHGGLDQALAFLLSWHTLDLLCKSWLVNLQREYISAESRLSRAIWSDSFAPVVQNEAEVTNTPQRPGSADCHPPRCLLTAPVLSVPQKQQLHNNSGQFPHPLATHACATAQSDVLKARSASPCQLSVHAPSHACGVLPGVPHSPALGVLVHSCERAGTCAAGKEKAEFAA